ncbi:hypothetical protein GCM10011321_22940 [Youhaiella tibetensis]|nr:hypothetical protein GCM10011321_22940 [Youhaiella tibetensis]
MTAPEPAMPDSASMICFEVKDMERTIICPQSGEKLELARLQALCDKRARQLSRGFRWLMD